MDSKKHMDEDTRRLTFVVVFMFVVVLVLYSFGSLV